MLRPKQFALMAPAVPAVAVMVSLMAEGRAIASAVRAALVQIVDEPAPKSYSESAGCNSYGCTAVFSRVPAGTALNI